jgi:hypothetical protein
LTKARIQRAFSLMERAMDLRIGKVEHFPAADLISRLRRVTMLKRPEIEVYANAHISLERIAVESLYPAQRYVLSQELLKVRQLSWELERFGYDLFKLDGYLRVWSEGAEQPINLLPPVVEESIERNGRVVNIINDGMHRLYLAYLQWAIPQVIFVRGVPKDLPYYAYPNPGQWQGIELIDALPESYIKKWHRIRDYHALYRNFNSAFENVGAPRGRFSGKPGT